MGGNVHESDLTGLSIVETFESNHVWWCHVDWLVSAFVHLSLQSLWSR